MRINFDPAHPFIEPWHVTISDGWLMRHNSQGEWMYGVESCVHPDYRSQGVGGQLIEARFEVARRLNLRGMVAGSVLFSYHRHAEQYSPDAYLQAVISGEVFDMNLSKQMRKGFLPLVVIPNYVTDPEALGWGAVIVWHNPEYDPSRKSQRVRARSYTFYPHSPVGEVNHTGSASVERALA
jgi:GNAT superfamily N-acetyltransferase